MILERIRLIRNIQGLELIMNKVILNKLREIIDLCVEENESQRTLENKNREQINNLGSVVGQAKKSLSSIKSIIKTTIKDN